MNTTADKTSSNADLVCFALTSKVACAAAMRWLYGTLDLREIDCDCDSGAESSELLLGVLAAAAAGGGGCRRGKGRNGVVGYIEKVVCLEWPRWILRGRGGRSGSRNKRR
jgi:hypothetical protein